MPQRIIRACIVRGMKPHQLIAALMAKEGLGSLPFAKKLGRPSMQSQIYRYAKGDVPEPEPSTAVPIAKYFKIPLEAMYDEKVATAVAAERKIQALPQDSSVTRKRAPRRKSLSEEALKFAERIEDMSPEQRQRLAELIEQAGNVSPLQPKQRGGMRQISSPWSANHHPGRRAEDKKGNR